jgi:serine/threonine protein phosphatase PrpC
MEKICEIEKRTKNQPINRDTALLTKDILLFILGFLLTRCHFVFGAHPLGLAFLAALPIGVWSTLLGAAIGGISMGLDGVIFAASAAITVFLRAAVSADKLSDGTRALFSESLPLRMSISILGGFISGVYEVVLRGLSETSLAFGVCMVVAPPIFTFIFSGLFDLEIDLDTIISGDRELLSIKSCRGRRRYEIIFFVISSLTLIFFIGLSLKAVTAFGISAVYIYSGVLTLLVAKRFGAIYGLAAGFASSLSSSGVLSVAFALAGLCSGALFSIGTGYALIIGGVALSAFSGYTEGLGGLVSTLPEYLIASTLALPLLKKVDGQNESESETDDSESAEDMVGTMALVYQKEYQGLASSLAGALTALADTMERHANGFHCESEEYRLFSALIDGAKLWDGEETSVDRSMTTALTEAVSRAGFEGGVIRAFGKRNTHFFLAGVDSGRKITSFEIRKSIEEAAGVKLAAPECYRKGRLALMECGIRRKLSVSLATASLAGDEKEISGDTVCTFETEDDYFCALLCDGMGSGEVAKATSTFAADYIKTALTHGADGDTMMLMLNRVLKGGDEECSSTVDLFRLDLLRGGGEFIKSGAAPSFVKRDSSIFRIRSHTAPIGLMSVVDSERTKTEIKPGDYIFIMSDGVSDESEDAPWLLLLLGEEPPKSLDEYAKTILTEARKNRESQDDMSIIVIRVNEI